MDNLLPHDIIIKIANAQKEHTTKIKNSVDAEIQYIKDSIKIYIEKEQERLLKNPFDTYIKIPFKNYDYKDKLYVSTFKNKYHDVFKHSLILDCSVNCFVVHFTSHMLVNNDNRPDTNSVSAIIKESDEPAKQCITEEDKKKFDELLDKPPPLTRTKSLVPLFLGRRNSHLSIPIMSSRKPAQENSFSETERSLTDQ